VTQLSAESTLGGDQIPIFAVCEQQAVAIVGRVTFKLLYSHAATLSCAREMRSLNLVDNDGHSGAPRAGGPEARFDECVWTI